MKRIFIILTLFLFSCNNDKYADIIKNADKAEFSFDFDDGPASANITDRKVIEEIGKVLDGKRESCVCMRTGLITIYSDGKKTMKIGMSTPAGGSTDECQYLIVQNSGDDKCYKLTYNMGMFLDELRNEVKK